MTYHEAQKRKAYCGLCAHWRLSSKECESLDEKYMPHGISRDDCAKIKTNLPPCVLGFCEVKREGIFADEMYAGKYVMEEMQEDGFSEEEICTALKSNEDCCENWELYVQEASL